MYEYRGSTFTHVLFALLVIAVVVIVGLVFASWTEAAGLCLPCGVVFILVVALIIVLDRKFQWVH